MGRMGHIRRIGHVKYSLILFSVMLILSVALASTGYATDNVFKSFDRNKDGRISREEFDEDMKGTTFGRLDSDSDKYISLSEWKSLNNVTDEKKHMELFGKIDRDKDKKINFFEYSDYADMHSNIYQAFIGLDKDGSDYLSPDEITLRPLFRMITIRLW